MDGSADYWRVREDMYRALARGGDRRSQEAWAALADNCAERASEIERASTLSIRIQP